jgi:hypothetical protein
VDGLARDPLAAAWGLTPAAYAAAAAEAAAWGAPLLLLGGGGYDSAAAAAAWAGAVAALLGRKLPDEVPEHDHLHRYGPGFTLSSGTVLPPFCALPRLLVGCCVFEEAGRQHAASAALRLYGLLRCTPNPHRDALPLMLAVGPCPPPPPPTPCSHQAASAARHH